MITTQTQSAGSVREKARKALTDYLSLFLPGSWQEPLARVRIILQSNPSPDWEAFKGLTLLFFEERKLSSDRVESLARIERLADSFSELYSTISPTEWLKTLEDVIHAANFRTSKIAVHTSPFLKTRLDTVDEDTDEE